MAPFSSLFLLFQIVEEIDNPEPEPEMPSEAIQIVFVSNLNDLRGHFWFRFWQPCGFGGFGHLTNFLIFKGCWRDWQSGAGTGNALRGHSNCVCLHVVLVARNCAHFFGDSGSYEFAHYKTLYPRHAGRFQKKNWSDNQRQTRKLILFLICLEMYGKKLFQNIF